MEKASRLLSFKVVLRCADFDRSHDFYTRVLGFLPIEEWKEEQGRGCIMHVVESAASAHLEIYEMSRLDPRFREAFARPLENDKIDLQIEALSLDEWIERLGGEWPYTGPDVLPWGQRWIKLRDPDNFLIAIYERV